MLPSQFINLSQEEKAFIIAAIDLKLEAEKKKTNEMKSKTRKKH